MNLISRIIRLTALRIGTRVPVSVRNLIKRIVPKPVWLKYTTIYPLEIPEVTFASGKDVILLELPQRYAPMMPNGLGYVHNILKTSGVSYQTVDLNIIFYHRYHSRRILGGLDKVTAPNGFVMPDDPWDTMNSEQWNSPELIEYFRPQITEVIDGLVRARPRIIGLSISETNRAVAREVVRGVRARYPEVTILIGGYDCVYHYVAPFLFPDFDYAVIGEAELTLAPLLKALVAGEKPRDLPGIVSKNDSPGRTWTPAPLLNDLDSIDFPRYEWLDLKLYKTYQNAILVPIISSRGCRWGRCRFCAECFPWRKRSPAKVVDEMEWFTRQGLSTFLFNESDMNGDPDSLLAICAEIGRKKLKVNFSGELRVDKRNSPEFFRRLHQAGCNQLVFGVDGWCDHVLRLENKGYNMALVEQNLRDCREAGIGVFVNMVIGVPGETEEDITESINNIIKLKRYIDCFQNLNILLLKSGSQYYLDPEKYDIHFRADKRELYEKYPYIIPVEMWYSENPRIDLAVRVAREKRIHEALNQAGVFVGKYAEWEVDRDKKSSQGS